MKPCLALGTFDGVHVGHRSVVRAAAAAGTCVAVAFDVPPKGYKDPSVGLLLCDPQEKRRLLTDCGASRVDYLDFPTVRDWSPQTFFDWLIETYAPQALVCGDNYTFGRAGAGRTGLLAALCDRAGVALTVCPAVCVNGEPVSSSRIRQLLAAGKVREAQTLLGRPFSFAGTVEHGDERGRTIGVPTLNVAYPPTFAALKNGVYRARVTLDGQTYDSVCNVGVRPTFATKQVWCEAHLLAYDGNAYGKTAGVQVLDFIREEKRFSSLEELAQAIRRDIAAVQKHT